MNPKTGQIYAMATSDPYAPNEPAAISDEKTAAELAGLDEDSNDYKQKQLDAWSLQWKNKAVSETYNPGSVFKVITGASALEEKAITLNDTFGCGTQIQVEDTTFHCWSTTDHGSQDLAQAMLNSCNPVFIQIGMKLGSEKFCQYYNAFGFNELTGIDLPAESNSISMPLSNMGPVQLASSSFGQTNKVTPIQMITAYSAAINGGYLVTPQVVNSITDENGNIVNSVNLPNVSMSMTGDAKICVIHKNVEGLIAKITTCITEAGMNIENMESKSKKDYAYTVLDVKGNADSVADKIRAGEAVISVRVIK